ncbi:MAG: PilZ domain-containing protein [Terriglobales bacterium]|jgi:hypothetical protein
MAGRNDPEEDRRRSPRFSCGGRAEIQCLPSSGIVIPGTIRDLSLHGCHVESSLPIACGARAEIVVRVNSASFRAVGEVRAIRGRSGAGVEFAYLSAGGKELLTGLITDLARLQALMNKLKAKRREVDGESFRRELADAKAQAAIWSERFPFLCAISPAEDAGDRAQDESKGGKAAPASKDGDGDYPAASAKPLIVAVDLFG